MATSLPTSAKDMRECSVCLEDMLQKSPKLLECKHSFCTPCLSALAEAHAGSLGLRVSCPKCKHNTVIKSGKLSDLPDNFLLQEVKAALDEQRRCNYCFYCSMVNQETVAVNLCVTCCRFMCKNCSEKHRTRFVKHDITFIMKEKEQEFCQKHNQVVVKVCSACPPVRLLCDVCMMLDEPCHGDEHLIDYTTALSREEEDLKSKIDQCNVDDVLSKFNATIQKEMSEVQENVVFIKQSLDILVGKATLLMEQSMDFRALNLAAKEVKECKLKAQKLLEHDIRQLDGIHDITEEITKALKTFSEKETKTETAYKKTCSDRQILQELLNIRQSLCYVLQVRLQPVKCWPTKAAVSKLRATMEGRVVYVCKGIPVITEINADGMKRELQTKHDFHRHLPTDNYIESCGNNLYVTCYNISESSTKVYKFDLQTDIKKPFPSFSNLKFLFKGLGWSLVDICVRDANNIMLIRPLGEIHRYNESSGKVMDYNFPYSDEHIQLTSEKADGQPRFIATCVKNKAILVHDNECNTIKTLSKDGFPFKQPRATTINAKGNILVADFGTCKIVEITMKGEFVRDVLTKQNGLRHPVNVAYSHPYLWVADQTKDGDNQLKCFL